MDKFRTMLALLLLLGAAPALAQDDANGVNDDPSGTTVEGGEGVSGLGEQADAGSDESLDKWTFGAIDSDGDGALTAEEFGSGLYGIVAGDGEGLSEDSYVLVIETYGIDPEMHSFEDADANGDGLITEEDEFVPGVASQVFSDFDVDSDAVLTPDEYAGGMLAGLDIDNSGTVSMAELERSAEWFGEPGVEGIAGGGAASEDDVIDEDFFLGGVDATERQDIGGPGDESGGAAGGGAVDDASSDGDAGNTGPDGMSQDSQDDFGDDDADDGTNDDVNDDINDDTNDDINDDVNDDVNDDINDDMNDADADDSGGDGSAY